MFCSDKNVLQRNFIFRYTLFNSDFQTCLHGSTSFAVFLNLEQKKTDKANSSHHFSLRQQIKQVIVNIKKLRQGYTVYNVANTVRSDCV